MRLIIAIAAMSLMLSANAQQQLKVSTGSGTGNYSRMFKEFQGVCKDEIMQVEVPSTGAVQNVDRLTGNEVNAGIAQTDVLYFRARTEDLSGVKTLFSLYPEEVHVLAPAVSPIKEGGTLGINQKPIQLGRFEDLAGRTVAAWGGSVVTAQLIRLQSEVPITLVETQNFKQAMEMLSNGTAAALLMVGGQQMADIATLNSNYKLLPFSEQTVGKLKNVYIPANLNYSNLGANGVGVKTVATEALYVTRTYRTPKLVQALAALRDCFKRNLPELQETTGMHKKWQNVTADNTGKWPYYDLPTGAAAASTAAPAPAAAAEAVVPQRKR